MYSKKEEFSMKKKKKYPKYFKKIDEALGIETEGKIYGNQPVKQLLTDINNIIRRKTNDK